MVYSTQALRWKAYQFLDPFALGSFLVCNAKSKVFCRPDCDAHPIAEQQHEVKFVDSVADATELGFSPCDSCDPLCAPKVDVKLLIQAVNSINASIGFTPPLAEELEELASPLSDKGISPLDANSSVSKNEADHYRLADLACRHLAMAAAQSVLSSAETQANSPDAGGEKKSRRRRGGVLGFKELAAKSKLSAWHFHRVFKSVTGLTPKTYGDKCWEYLKLHCDGSVQSPAQALSSVSSLSSTDLSGSMSSGLAHPMATSLSTGLSSGMSSSSAGLSASLKSYATPVLSVSASSPRKRSHDEEFMMPLKRASFDASFTPDVSPVMMGFDKMPLDQKLWATPAEYYSATPQTLFTHVKSAPEPEFSPDFGQMDEMAPMSMMPMDMAADKFLDTIDYGFPNDMFVNDEQTLLQPEGGALSDPFSLSLSPELLTSNPV